MRSTPAAVVRRLPSESRAEVLLVEIRAEQVRQGALLERILAALAHGRGPRDGADRTLLLAILESVGDRSFTCTKLVQHAELVDPGLRGALLAADVQTPHELGVLLRRLHGVTIDGLRVERADTTRTREGVLWRVRLSEDDRRIGASGEDRAHD